MSREIKFRGKRIDNSEWVYGAFIPDALEKTRGDMVTCGFIQRHNKETGRMEMVEVDRETVVPVPDGKTITDQQLRKEWDKCTIALL